MKTFIVEVTRVVTVELDETKLTPEFMDDFREHMFNFNSIEEHARNLAVVAVNGLAEPDGFIEGYGVPSEMGIKLSVDRPDAEVVQ